MRFGHSSLVLASRAIQPIALHSARHTFASILIAAGVNAKALMTYVGHTSSRPPWMSTGI
jgi:integrase